MSRYANISPATRAEHATHPATERSMALDGVRIWWCGYAEANRRRSWT